MFFAFFLILGDLLAPFWIPLALWGRPWAEISLHFSLIGLQKGALGTSLGPFGRSQDPPGIDLGVLGRLLEPKLSKIGANMVNIFYDLASFWTILAASSGPGGMRGAITIKSPLPTNLFG